MHNGDSKMMISHSSSWLLFLFTLLHILIHRSVSALTTHTTNQLQLEVAKSRNFVRAGFVSGGGLVAVSAALGVSIGLVDANAVVAGTIASSAAFLAYVESNSLRGASPAPPNNFQVKQSLIPDAGMGLFCMTFLTKGTFLFPYTGEILTEDAYFQRYPTGQGRYVAEVPTFVGNPVYIDGADPEKSGLARWMNSKPVDTTNVEWRKQNFGPKAGSMYFYARRDIFQGEELTFDYCASYWDAVVEEDEE